MLLSYGCSNFKCFRETGNIDLSKITLLVGPNNSGKSSLISALNIISSTSFSEDSNIYLKLLSKDYDYGTFKDISFNHDESKLVTFNLTITKPQQRLFPNSTQISNKIIGDKVTFAFAYGLLNQRKEIYLDHISINDDIGEIFNITEDKYSKSIKIWARDIKESYYKKLSSLFYKKGLIYKMRYNWHWNEKKLSRESIMFLMYISFLFDSLNSDLNQIYHLGPLRIPPSRSYLFSGELAERIGDNGEKALSNYATIKNRRGSRDNNVVDSINNSLIKLGFISKIEFKKIGDRHYEFWTEHPSSKLAANLADTGFGASQVIPVIFLLYTVTDGSIILVEQPELHLHPAAQAELGTIIKDACIDRNIKIVIETHSENLILRLLTEVALGHISKDDLAIYYIQSNVSQHELLRIHINDKGEFLDQWPNGFFDEGYQESLKLIKARGGVKINA